jgi:hypothetical protein
MNAVTVFSIKVILQLVNEYLYGFSLDPDKLQKLFKEKDRLNTKIKEQRYMNKSLYNFIEDINYYNNLDYSNVKSVYQYARNHVRSGLMSSCSLTKKEREHNKNIIKTYNFIRIMLDSYYYAPVSDNSLPLKDTSISEIINAIKWNNFCKKYF